MTFHLPTGDFLGSTYSELLTACHEGAQQALSLASAASNPTQRAMYMDLVRQWDSLAHDIEHAMEAEYKSSAAW
jgi:hypothetical protein